jgi:hypothetical protein
MLLFYFIEDKKLLDEYSNKFKRICQLFSLKEFDIEYDIEKSRMSTSFNEQKEKAKENKLYIKLENKILKKNS